MRPKGASAAAGDALHLYRHPSDTRSICGLHRPLPVVLAAHAAAHVVGRGAALCPACAGGQLALEIP